MTSHTETMNNLLDMDSAYVPAKSQGFVVVHPLYDAPEAKCDTEHLGPMRMSRGCRIALGSVRIYLVAMILVTVFRVLQFAGAFRR